MFKIFKYKLDYNYKVTNNMKKLICFISIMALFAMVSCGSNTATTGDDKDKNEIIKEISVIGADGFVYHSYQTACSKGDFDAARDYLGMMKNQLVEIKGKGWSHEDEANAYAEAIKDAEDYIANEEIQYLASLNEEQADNRIILILNQRSIEGHEAAEMTCLGKKIYKLDIEKIRYSPDAIKQYLMFISWCGDHNSKCRNVLSIAIACGNQSLAKKILHSFRKDPEFLLKNEKKEFNADGTEFLYYDVYAHYTNASKEAAQKKYDEAVKSGAFN